MPRIYTPRVESACALCGVVRSYRPSEIKRYCSRACMGQAYRKRADPSKSVTQECAECSQPYTNLISQIGRYCSKPCADRSKVQPVDQRFWSKVGPPDENGCRDWLAGVGTDGYGKFWINGQTVHASAVAYELTYGPLPPDKPLACHTCNRPICCEPTHLYADNGLGNQRYMVEQGRSTTGERHTLARLTTDDVLAIRRRWTAGSRGVDLARAFGTSPTNVSAIVHRRAWKHV